MKNLFYSLCLLIGFTSWALPVDLETLSLNFNDIKKNITKTPDCELDALFNVNHDNSADESFEFDTKNYLPANFNSYSGLFEAHESAQVVEDEAFEFDTAAYLPVGFNANATYLSEITEITFVEEDEAFEFDTADYLPEGFNANETYLSNITEIALVEADEPFDFNTADYLPVGFNVYNILEEIVDIEIIEEDEPFDFNTYDYLPSTFDAYVNFHQSEAAEYLSCMVSPAI